MKKVLVIVIIFIVLLILALWGPWYKWNFNFYSLVGINTPEKYSDLKVKSLAGTIDIYIDKQYQGSVSDNEDSADIASITSGEHEITLKRSSQYEYYEFDHKVDFEQGVETVIAYDLGPSEIFSEGHILYAKKNFANNGNPKLLVYCSPSATKVYLDGIYVGDTPLQNIDLDPSKQHTIKLQKTGYIDLEFKILPDNETDREKLSGFDIVVEAKLFLKPFYVINQ